MKIVKLGGKVIVHGQKNSKVKIGFGNINIIDDKYQRSMWFNEGTIEFGGNAVLGKGCKISNSGSLVFGDNFTVNGTTSIVCKKAMQFGNNVLISWDCLIMDTDFHKIRKCEDEKQIQINTDKDIIFGNNIWIGCRSTILKGSYIPNGSVIAAGSYVTKSLMKTNAIYHDNEVIKENINWNY